MFGHEKGTVRSILSMIMGIRSKFLEIMKKQNKPKILAGVFDE